MPWVRTPPVRVRVRVCVLGRGAGVPCGRGWHRSLRWSRVAAHIMLLGPHR